MDYVQAPSRCPGCGRCLYCEPPRYTWNLQLVSTEPDNRATIGDVIDSSGSAVTPSWLLVNTTVTGTSQ